MQTRCRRDADVIGMQTRCRRDRDADEIGMQTCSERVRMTAATLWDGVNCIVLVVGMWGKGVRGGRMECMAHVLRGMQCGDVGRFGWTSAPTRV